MKFFNKISCLSGEKKLAVAMIILLGLYFFSRVLFFSIDVFNFDETWHSNYMNTSFYNQIKTYQAFSPLYWIFGHLIMKSFGYFNVAFGKLFLRLVFFGFYFGAILLIYKNAKKEKSRDLPLIFLVIFLILSAPISFFSGKAITPEYLQLFLFSICLYCLSSDKKYNEQKFIWFLSGIAGGLKMHALAVLPFLFFFKIIKNQSGKKYFDFDELIKLAKTSIPFSLLGLLVANFPFFTNFSETVEDFRHVNSGGLSALLSNLRTLLFKGNPQCWESICPQYVKAGYSHLIYDLLPPLSFLFVILSFLTTATNRKNISVFFLLVFLILFIELFIATGYANYPWYHLTYVPLLLSLFLHLDLKDLSKFRKNSLYSFLILAIFCNLFTTIYIIKTNYGLRIKAANLINENTKNTLCIDDMLFEQKPDVYIFGVISLYNGYSKTLIDSNSLIERHFPTSVRMFRDGGYLEEGTIKELAENKKLKIIFSLDDVSAIYNPSLFGANASIIKTLEGNFTKEWEKNFPAKKITSKLKALKSCKGIKNYALQMTVK